MTSVNVTTSKNTVTVNEGDATIITVATQGPQGPQFSSTGKGLTDSSVVGADDPVDLFMRIVLAIV